MINNGGKLLETIVAILDGDTAVAVLPSHFKSMRSQLQEWLAVHKGQDLPPEVRWEISALDMYAVPRRQRQDSPDERFRPMSEFCDHDTDPPTVRVYPDVTGLLNDKQAIDYYRHRSEETSNPIRKARYADIVWIALRRQGDRNAYRYGITSADAYLEQVLLCLAKGDQPKAYIELVNNLDRAAEFAVLLNNRALADRVIKTITDSSLRMKKDARNRWVLEMGDTLLYISSKFRDAVTEEVWMQFRKAFAEGIAHHEREGSSYLARDLMQLASEVSNRLGDPTSAWDYQVQIAESLETESSRREKEEGATGAYKFMEDALRCYQRLVSLAPDDEEKQRLQGKVTETKREIRLLIRQSESEMKRISASGTIPKDVLEQVVAPLLEVESERTLEMLSSAGFLLPDIADIRCQAAKAAEKHVFASLLGRVSLRDGRKVDEIPAMEGETVHFLDHLSFWFQSHAQFLDFVFYRLREEGRFSTGSFMAHLQRWELLDEADIRFIEVGVERYFADDFISALHVLTPRIEHMIKSAFEQMGLTLLVVPNQRQIREQTFGDFLHREEVRRVLGEDIWYYLYYVLVNEKGLNLRNDVAHGWISVPACNRTLVQVVLFAILLLTRLRLSTTPDHDDSDLAKMG